MVVVVVGRSHGERRKNFREMSLNQAEASHYCFDPLWKLQQTCEDWPDQGSQVRLIGWKFGLNQDL